MKRARLLDMLLAGCFLTALIMSRIVDLAPDGRLQISNRQIGDACLFHRWTHLDCPFCGISRSMIALMHGHLSDSFSYHPLGLCLAVLFVGFIAAVGVATYRKDTPIIQTKTFSALMLAVIIMSLSAWCIRAMSDSKLPNLRESMVQQ